MTKTVPSTPATETESADKGEKTSIKANRENYVDARSASGSKSLHNGDVVATLIQGMDVDDCHRIAKKFLGESTKEKYGHLNVGMQRMNVGNRLRGKVAAIDAANAKVLAGLKEDEKAPDQVSGSDQLVAIAQPFRDKTDKALKEAAEKKVKDDKTKADEKEAKAVAKATADKEKAAKATEKAESAASDK